MPDPFPESLTLHSSWKGIVSNALGALLVLGGGVLAVSVGGWRVLSTIVFVGGLILCLIVIFDYPIASTFTADGVSRRMIGRRHHLRWDRVAQLTRARPGIAAGFRKLAHGGLVARVGRRRYLLVDRCESGDEFALLEAVLTDRPEIVEMVPRPTESTEPTWLYRRAKWAPQRTRRR